MRARVAVTLGGISLATSVFVHFFFKFWVLAPPQRLSLNGIVTALRSASLLQPGASRRPVTVGRLSRLTSLSYDSLSASSYGHHYMSLFCRCHPVVEKHAEAERGHALNGCPADLGGKSTAGF